MHNINITSVNWSRIECGRAIGPFRHSDISVKAVNQHGGRLYCVTLTYVRLRSGHMTHEKGLY